MCCPFECHFPKQLTVTRHSTSNTEHRNHSKFRIVYRSGRQQWMCVGSTIIIFHFSCLHQNTNETNDEQVFIVILKNWNECTVLSSPVCYCLNCKYVRLLWHRIKEKFYVFTKYKHCHWDYLCTSTSSTSYRVNFWMMFVRMHEWNDSN